MDLTQLANLGEFVGGIAVLVTLIYLAVQVRHTSKAIQANSAQAFATSINEVNFIAGRDPDRARVVRLAFEDPASMTVDEQSMTDWMCLAICRTFESALLQAELGQFDAQTLGMVKQAIRDLFATECYQSWWARHPYLFTKRFYGFVRDEFDLETSS